jgi:hypothetical protein
MLSEWYCTCDYNNDNIDDLITLYIRKSHNEIQNEFKHCKYNLNELKKLDLTFDFNHLLMALFVLATVEMVEYLKDKTYTGAPDQCAVIQDIVQWNYIRIRYYPKFIFSSTPKKVFYTLNDEYCKLFNVMYDKHYFNRQMSLQRPACSYIDPTYKLVVAIYCSKIFGAAAVMRDIEHCIVSGARLADILHITDANWSDMCAVVYAVRLRCDPVIVRRLRREWWYDDSSAHVIVRHKHYFSDPEIERLTMRELLENMYGKSDEEDEDVLEYAKIFGYSNLEKRYNKRTLEAISYEEDPYELINHSYVTMINNIANKDKNIEQQANIIDRFKIISKPLLIKDLLTALNWFADPIIIEYLKEKCYLLSLDYITAVREIIQYNYYIILYSDDDIEPVDHNLSRDELNIILLALNDKYCEMFGVTYDKNYFSTQRISTHTKVFNPTKKLMLCLKFSKHIGLAVMDEIEICIASGAALSKEYEICGGGVGYIPPIIYAIVTYCDPVIVRALKDAWWDDSYHYEDGCALCAEDGMDEIIQLSIAGIFKKQLQRRDANVEMIHEYARMFRVYDEVANAASVPRNGHH